MKSWKLVSLTLLVLLLCTALANATFDLGGRTVRIDNQFTNITPLGPRGDYDWLTPDARLRAHIENVEQMFNCKIEFVQPIPTAQRIQMVTSQLLAGDVGFDIIVLPPYQLPFLAAQGLLHPLSNVVDDELISGYIPGLWHPETSTVRDDFYGFPRLVQELGPPDVGGALIWNKSLFEREGLPNLYDLYEADEWTWEQFRNFARLLTRDTDGDGRIDRYALRIAGYGTPETAGHFIVLNGGNTVREIDGKMTITLDEPQAIEALEFLQNLMFHDQVVGGARGISAMEYVFSDAIQYDQYQNSDDVWGIVPMAKGPSADEYVAPSAGGWQAALPITVENPRELIEVFNALMLLTDPYYAEDLAEREWQVWEEDHRARVALDREGLETMRWSSLNKVVIADSTLLIENGLEWAVNSLVRDGGSPISIINQIKPALQSVIDDFYKQ